MKNELVDHIRDHLAQLSSALVITHVHETGSFDDIGVQFKDGHVEWQVLRERSTFHLLAAPDWDHTVWFDEDLLQRMLSLLQGTSPCEIRSADSVSALMDQLRELRQPVADLFQPATWPDIKQRLLELGRRRDHEVLGRPFPATPRSGKGSQP